MESCASIVVTTSTVFAIWVHCNFQIGLEGVIIHRHGRCVSRPDDESLLRPTLLQVSAVSMEEKTIPCQLRDSKQRPLSNLVVSRRAFGRVDQKLGVLDPRNMRRRRVVVRSRED